MRRVNEKAGLAWSFLLGQGPGVHPHLWRAPELLLTQLLGSRSHPKNKKSPLTYLYLSLALQPAYKIFALITFSTVTTVPVLIFTSADDSRLLLRLRSDTFWETWCFGGTWSSPGDYLLLSFLLIEAPHLISYSTDKTPGERATTAKQAVQFVGPNLQLTFSFFHFCWEQGMLTTRNQVFSNTACTHPHTPSRNPGQRSQP